jgi:hypothetical protein
MPKLSPVAKSIPFDNTTNSFLSKDVQSAIEEARDLIADSSKAFTFCYYNGNAGTGRFLEFFPNIGSNEAPIRVVGPLDVLTIVARTTGSNATCTVGFYNYTPVTPVLLYTLTFTAVKEVVISGLPVFTVPANGTLVIRVDSGSITKPHLYFSGQGG